MRKQETLISVVMSVYNAAQYLREAIDSILNQTFKEFEFIIINDGSTDRSLEIIKSYDDSRIMLIQQENTGLATALNNGIKNAHGKYIARMDSDDISYKDRFAIQYNFLEENKNVIAIGSNADIIDKDGTYVYTTNLLQSSIELKNKLPHRSPFMHPSVMLRKKTLEKVGLYPDVPLVEDLFLFNKMAEHGEYANIDKPLIQYRLTPSASSRRSKLTQNVLKDAVGYYHAHSHINDEHIKIIIDSIKKTDNNKRQYHYHLRLAKKYLWNNYRPALARKNIRLAIKYKMTDPMLLLLYLLSFLPAAIVSEIYQRFK